MAGRGALLAAVLTLIAIPVTQRAQGAHDEQTDRELFQTSDRCMACHNTLATSAGEDISIGFAWRPTMMANSARDPYWQAGVRRESIDHPESAGGDRRRMLEVPHADGEYPVQVPEARAGGVLASRLRLGRADRPDGAGRRVVFALSSDQAGQSRHARQLRRRIRHRHDPASRASDRNSARSRLRRAKIASCARSSGGYQPTEGKHIRQSELCATCHTLITTALGPNGQKIGELPEQMPYQEWFNSDFRDTQSCQSCHMPVVEEPVRMTSALGEFREGVSRHVFVGGNFFMQRMLNRYRGELGVVALPAELEGAAARTIEHLQSKTAQDCR